MIKMRWARGDGVKGCILLTDMVHVPCWMGPFPMWMGTPWIMSMFG